MTKDEIRQKVRLQLAQAGAARFPEWVARVPNFRGAERAAQLLRELPMWKRARVVKVSCDAPQLAVRRAAIAEHKILYLAVPLSWGIGLTAILDIAKPGDRIFMCSYGSGSGSDAFIWTVTDRIAQVQALAATTRDLLDNHRIFLEYGQYAKFRRKILKAE